MKTKREPKGRVVPTRRGTPKGRIAPAKSRKYRGPRRKNP